MKSAGRSTAEPANAAAANSARVAAAIPAGIAVVSAASTDSAAINAYGAATIAADVPTPVSASVPATVSKSPVVADVAVSVAPSTPIPAVEPGTGADEHAAVEPVRAPVAVGGAGVRVIRVIAPLADRRPAKRVGSRVTHFRADADTDGDLGLCRLCQCKGHRQQRNQHNVAQNAHDRTSCQTALMIDSRSDAAPDPQGAGSFATTTNVRRSKMLRRFLSVPGRIIDSAADRYLLLWQPGRACFTSAAAGEGKTSKGGSSRGWSRSPSTARSPSRCPSSRGKG